MPSYSYAFSSTSFTHSCTILFDVGIKKVIGVSLRAVGFLSLKFCEFQPKFPTPTIFLVRDWFKVSWINANEVTAKVVKFFAGWYRCNKQLVGEAVSTHILPLTIFNSKNAVSSAVFTRCPNPTTTLAALINLFPKSVFYFSHITIIPRITTKVKRAGYVAVEPLIEE